MVQPFNVPSPVNYLGNAMQINRQNAQQDQQNALMQRDQQMQEQQFQGQQQDRQTAQAAVQRKLQADVRLAALHTLQGVPEAERRQVFESMFHADDDWRQTAGEGFSESVLSNPLALTDGYIGMGINKLGQMTQQQEIEFAGKKAQAIAKPTPRRMVQTDRGWVSVNADGSDPLDTGLKLPPREFAPQAPPPQQIIQMIGPDGKPVYGAVNPRNPGGGVTPIPGAVPVPIAPKTTPTEGQAKALLFGARAREVNTILDRLESEGVVGQPAYVRALGAVPGAGEFLSNAASSPEVQMLTQAKEDYINAVLRRESGAAISDGERVSANRQYFPQLNDSPQVIAQKARNRRLAVRGILAEVPENMRNSVQGESVPNAPAPAPRPRVAAPATAVAYLRAHPDAKTKAQFKAKYGYLP